MSESDEEDDVSVDESEENVEIFMDEPIDELDEGGSERQAISQIDSSINKSFVETEEEAGIMPYPKQDGGFDCLRYLCCVGPNPLREPPLLGEQPASKLGRKCLVLDLDETLVHSSFQNTDLAHYKIPLDLEEGMPPRMKHFEVFVIKRPGVDDFLSAVTKEYEVIIFTASIERYAVPLLNLLDPEKHIDAQLYRESCTEYRGSYVKDLRRLGRNLKDVIIVDNSKAAYQFQPENAIPCLTFIDDMSDDELSYCKDFLLSDAVLNASDVRSVLDTYNYQNPKSIAV